MLWFRPWMAWAALCAALAVTSGIQTVRLSGEEAAHAETQRLHAEAMAKAVEEARSTENKLRGDLEQIQAAAAKEKEIAKSREDALVDAVRSGERRLRIAAVCPGGAAAGVNSAAAGGGGAGVQVAELAPEAGERILRIGIDGDRYIRERNACVAAYEAVRQKLNAAAAQ